MSLKTIQLKLKPYPLGKRGGTTVRALATEESQSKATHHSRVSHRSRVKRYPHQATREPRLSHGRRLNVSRIGKNSRSGKARGRVLLLLSLQVERSLQQVTLRTRGNAGKVLTAPTTLLLSVLR